MYLWGFVRRRIRGVFGIGYSYRLFVFSMFFGFLLRFGFYGRVFIGYIRVEGRG